MQKTIIYFILLFFLSSCEDPIIEDPDLNDNNNDISLPVYVGQVNDNMVLDSLNLVFEPTTSCRETQYGRSCTYSDKTHYFSFDTLQNAMEIKMFVYYGWNVIISSKYPEMTFKAEGVSEGDLLDSMQDFEEGMAVYPTGYPPAYSRYMGISIYVNDYVSRYGWLEWRFLKYPCIEFIRIAYEK